jgi:hypothetical protein
MKAWRLMLYFALSTLDLTAKETYDLRLLSVIETSLKTLNNLFFPSLFERSCIIVKV